MASAVFLHIHQPFAAMFWTHHLLRERYDNVRGKVILPSGGAVDLLQWDQDAQAYSPAGMVTSLEMCDGVLYCYPVSVLPMKWVQPWRIQTAAFTVRNPGFRSETMRRAG